MDRPRRSIPRKSFVEEDLSDDDKPIRPKKSRKSQSGFNAFQVVDEIPIEFDMSGGGQPPGSSDEDNGISVESMLEINLQEGSGGKGAGKKRKKGSSGGQQQRQEQQEDWDPLGEAPKKKQQPPQPAPPQPVVQKIYKNPPVNRYPCGYCDTVFTDISFLERHHKRCKTKRSHDAALSRGPGCSIPPPLPVQRMHYGGAKLYTCDQCTFSTKNPDHMKYHKPVHANDRPFACDECNFTCRELDHLNIHKQLHSGYKEFTFVDGGSGKKEPETDNGTAVPNSDAGIDPAAEMPSDLSDHSAIKKTEAYDENGDRLYSCDQCSYTSTRSGYLNMHKKIHERDQPFVCEDCGYRCTRLTYYKRHRLTHTADKIYACDLCTFTCTDLQELADHKKRHEEGNPNAEV